MRLRLIYMLAIDRSLAGWCTIRAPMGHSTNYDYARSLIYSTAIGGVQQAHRAAAAPQ